MHSSGMQNLCQVHKWANSLKPFENGDHFKCLKNYIMSLTANCFFNQSHQTNKKMVKNILNFYILVVVINL